MINIYKLDISKAINSLTGFTKADLSVPKFKK